MRSFKLCEISAVDRPAQEGARMMIMKRDFSQDERDKLSETGAAMSDGSFPIKTKADLENAIHDWGRAGSKPAVKDHIISRAKSLGATDLLPEGWVGKNYEVNMTEAEMQKKVDEAVKAATADLQKKLDDANETINKVGAANAKKPQASDAEDAVDGGADEDAEKKSKKFAEAVEAEVTKRLEKKDETVEYNGQTIRKSESGATFDVIKSLVEEAEITKFSKAADQTIGHLPGEQVAKAKALRAISKLDKEARETIEAMLKSGDAAVALGMKEIGKGGVSEGTAEAELNKRAEAYGVEKKLNKYIAMAEFLNTAEGKDLYKRVQEEKHK
jgi:hypothetical protein